MSYTITDIAELVRCHLVLAEPGDAWADDNLAHLLSEVGPDRLPEVVQLYDQIGSVQSSLKRAAHQARPCQRVSTPMSRRADLSFPLARRAAHLAKVDKWDGTAGDLGQDPVPLLEPLVLDEDRADRP